MCAEIGMFATRRSLRHSEGGKDALRNEWDVDAALDRKQRAALVVKSLQRQQHAVIYIIPKLVRHFSS
ncbi:hypothetical protein SPHINGO391_10007 [Sphingomonas aurantiaca]|uniref:Uncharacterized protein n=1 Tax=Sphingomonas aurantiaca TaxID=185949 RepID=A0A5E7XPJ6_9SPHN|nr:hypothetical protein SPHINGO391_10007 [Sphingomonas aurantiaca]